MRRVLAILTAVMVLGSSGCALSALAHLDEDPRNESKDWQESWFIDRSSHLTPEQVEQADKRIDGEKQ